MFFFNSKLGKIMQWITRIAAWWRRRRADARVRKLTLLSFDELVEQAQMSTTEASRRISGEGERERERTLPSYLPEVGAATRIGLSILGGSLLYSAIFCLYFARISGGWTLLLLGGTVVLLPASFHCLLMLKKAFFEDAKFHLDDAYAASAARIVLWPIVESFVLLCWVFPYTFYAIDRVRLRAAHFWRNGIEEPKAADATRSDAIRRVPMFVRDMINEEVDRLFGGSSSFLRIRQAIDAKLQEARQLLNYFERRRTDNGNEARHVLARERAEHACEQLATELNRMDEFRARVASELDAYRMKVLELSPDFEDLVQLQALSQVERDAVHLAAKAEVALLDATRQLIGRISWQCRDLSDALDDASVRIAVASSESDDAERDIAVIEHTVSELYARTPRLQLPKGVDAMH
jgi:hypothetical protein